MSVHWPNVKEALEKANTFGVSKKYEQWELLCFAAIHGYPGRFLDLFEWVHVSDLTYHIKTSMLLGKTLDGHLNPFKSLIFDVIVLQREYCKAETFVSFYYKQNALCRVVVDAWSCCAKRIGVCKDIRIMISKLVWSSRHDTIYVK
ncbi:MAG: hypothetical protein K2Q45_09010 [Nitrosomonas sp.]|nr:hypothetical protein [Nitrosomonas sp.]